MDGVGGMMMGESVMVEVEKLKVDLEDAETATRRAFEDAAKMEKELCDVEVVMVMVRVEIDDVKFVVVKEVEVLCVEFVSVMEKL